MENTADNGAFKDLLSAALSESGLTDDLIDFTEPGAQPANGGAIVPDAAAGTVIQQPITTRVLDQKASQVVPVGSLQGKPTMVQRVVAAPGRVPISGQAVTGQAGIPQGNIIRIQQPATTLVRTSTGQLIQRPAGGGPITVVRGKVAGTSVGGQKMVQIQNTLGATTVTGPKVVQIQNASGGTTPVAAQRVVQIQPAGLTPSHGQKVVHIQSATGTSTPVSVRTVVGRPGSPVVTATAPTNPTGTGKRIIRRVVLNPASAQRLAQLTGNQAGQTLSPNTQRVVMTRTPQGTLVARTPQGSVLPPGTVLTKTPEGTIAVRTPDGSLIRPTAVTTQPAAQQPGAMATVTSSATASPKSQYLSPAAANPGKIVHIVKVNPGSLDKTKVGTTVITSPAMPPAPVFSTPAVTAASTSLLTGSHVTIQPAASGAKQVLVTPGARALNSGNMCTVLKTKLDPELRSGSPVSQMLTGPQVISSIPAGRSFSPQTVLTNGPTQRTTSTQIMGTLGTQRTMAGSPLPTINPQLVSAINNQRSLTPRSLTPQHMLGPQRTATPPPSSQANGPLKTQVTDRDVLRLWANDDLKLKKLPMQAMPGLGLMPGPQLDTPLTGEDEDEELGHAETYAEYMPAKVRVGIKHPDPVVETSSLSSVEPPDVWYKLSIPESTIDSGALSALQLESITYSCQKHETMLASGEKAGYLIGDGAGVGKGRTVAGIIYENYLMGRKRALWLSVSNDLRVDAERDLRDIGAGKIEVHPLNKFKYAKISSHVNGSVKKGVIFATYSSLIGESQSGGKYRTRFKQLLQWLSKDFDGVIVFDECHKAKNLCPVGSSKPTKTGKTVLELQNKLPKARIVYASATGASEPRNMAYMTRLGLWGTGTPFPEFNDFIQAIEKRGVGAMELVAMDMKLRGMYIARQLSFHGVSFRVEEIPVPKDFLRVYNSAVKLWVKARENFQRAADLIDAEHRMKKSMWGQFWSAHQRFFKYLCISAKVPHCIKLAREAVKNGKCVVIGLQSTGEARTLEQVEELGGELNDFVSTAKGVFQTLVEKHFPAPDRKKTGFLFGLSSMFDSPAPSPKAAVGSKRKRDADGPDPKRSRNSFSDSDNSDSDESGKESDSDLDISDSESDSESEDDFNPFGGSGSDSDDDPWLKKSKKKKAPKPKKVKQKKEKKAKKNKKKKKGDEFDDIDNKFDRALEAAGLKSNSNGGLGSGAGSVGGSSVVPAADAVEQAVRMKQELLDALEEIGDRLPPNTLDQLIDALGGTENVAEMTGRKGRVVSTDDGIQYESRSEVDAPLEILNLTEKQRFMDGEKNIAIISEAASSGISLQADRRAINQRRRVHLTLELPWSADRAIQQFGRTHRSNQVSAPEYVFLISELAGEHRFASTVAKRLESLGALTHGDRRATESRDLSRFNIDNKYGRAALETVMKSILGQETPLVPLPENYSGNFYEDAKRGLVGVGMFAYEERFSMHALEKDYNNMSKFLNRILGVEVELQNLLFKYFTETLTAIILQAKRFGRWDMGILDLGSSGENVRQINVRNFLSQFSGAKVKTQLHTVAVERGMTWQMALGMWRENSGPEDGFYLAHQTKSDKRTAVLAIMMPGRRKEKLFNIYRPNTGLQLRAESLAEIKTKYSKVYPDEAKSYWEDQYQASAAVCSHAYWRGNCKRVAAGLSCEVGLRCRTYYVLSGSVLSCWNKVEAVLASLPGGHATRMQIIRLKTSDGTRIVGSLIPEQALQQLTALLSQDPTVKVGPPASLHAASLSSPNMAATAPFSLTSSRSLPASPHPAYRSMINNTPSSRPLGQRNMSAFSNMIKEVDLTLEDSDEEPTTTTSPPEASAHAFAPVPLGARAKSQSSPPQAAQTILSNPATPVVSVDKTASQHRPSSAAPMNAEPVAPQPPPSLLSMPTFV